MSHSTLPATLTQLALGAAIFSISATAIAGEPLKESKGPPKGEEEPVTVAAVKTDGKDPMGQTGAFKGNRLMYTTYFYTAAEAVVHGYEKDTKVRIVSMERGGTVWEGTVGPGETKLIPTGAGAFGFLSDKKATILVGTPSSCAVVGYWAFDQEGSARSDHFYTRLPSSTSGKNVRVVIWAWDDVRLQVAALGQDKKLTEKTLKAGEFIEYDRALLDTLGNETLDVRADKRAISVQVYYDQGFSVPAQDGRQAGKLFRTYVGDITQGDNQLQLITYNVAANIKVKDIKTGEELYKGKVEPKKLHALKLKNRYVEVTSDQEINVAVDAYNEWPGYAEHHFSGGMEGTGIETEFVLSSPQELWLFSYYSDNPVRVTDLNGREIWSGKLGVGQAMGIRPGMGAYHVKSSKGISVMGGASACGGQYSPAAGMFAVDEALFKVVMEIKEQRVAAAKAQGRTLTEAELNAPLSKEEAKTASTKVNEYNAKRAKAKSSGPNDAPAAAAAPSISADEAADRAAQMVTY
jgi:hypothetical protein